MSITVKISHDKDNLLATVAALAPMLAPLIESVANRSTSGAQPGPRGAREGGREEYAWDLLTMMCDDIEAGLPYPTSAQCRAAMKVLMGVDPLPRGANMWPERGAPETHAAP
jgi:hypothetical protein